MNNPNTNHTQSRPVMTRIQRASGYSIVWEIDGKLYNTPTPGPRDTPIQRNAAPEKGNRKMRKTVYLANGSSVTYVWTPGGWDVESTYAASGDPATYAVADYSYLPSETGIW